MPWAILFCTRQDPVIAVLPGDTLFVQPFHEGEDILPAETEEISRVLYGNSSPGAQGLDYLFPNFLIVLCFKENALLHLHEQALPADELKDVLTSGNQKCQFLF